MIASVGSDIGSAYSAFDQRKWYEGMIEKIMKKQPQGGRGNTGMQPRGYQPYM